jgi:AcrR family transcriptional regulator
VSPRGVAIPEVKEQLFQAAERVLFRDGPDGLTSRAITEEAGVAKGLLYNHFTDLDQFVAELVLDRARAAAQEAAALPILAGTGSVSANLIDASLSLLQSDALAIASIVMSRPSLMARLHEVAGGGPFSTLDEVERAFATYLEAEKKLGRITAETDTETLALTLVGTVHHIFLTKRATAPGLRKRVQRIVASLIGGKTPDWSATPLTVSRAASRPPRRPK